MQLSVSFLGIKDNIRENVLSLANSSVDYIHLDIMDGKFVPNESLNFEQMEQILKNANKPLDVHLMVEDVKSYIEQYIKLKPEFITFHVEVANDQLINLLKQKNIKVGLAINPSTNLKKLKPYLDKIDLILLMSVNPGMYGQKFIAKSFRRLKKLKKWQKKHNYLISIDGGINDQNITKINSDLVVVGSYITNGNYQEQIKKIKGEM